MLEPWKVTDDNCLHLSNAHESNLVILDGIVIEVKPASMNIFVLRYVRPDESVALVSDVHPLNASIPTEVTAFGSVIDVNPVHPMKAFSPIDVTVEGNVSVVNPVEI